jgi:hypothetical protein
MLKNLLVSIFLLPCLVVAQPNLQTRPERSHYTETSRYEDVMAFVRSVVARSPKMKLTTFGYTNEGRSLPLIVWGNVRDASPEGVKASGKTRMFVMANIHAGEVEGKEAMQVLLRDLMQGKHREWADSLVLLIAPIYNADGNERIRLTNRQLQYGPIGGMGQRPNAQDLDLNRDHIKLESPEARSLIRLLDTYDPHIWMDLHTTDGSVHAYHLTYAPPLHPNSPKNIDDALRKVILPQITDTIRRKYGWEYYYYGNMPDVGESYTNSRQPERAWYSFDHRPRFSNNYAGMRNRFGILSEAYSYATFDERIKATLYFVEEVANYARNHAKAIRTMTAQADAENIVGQKMGLRASLFKNNASVDILAGDVSVEKNPYTGETMWKRLPTKRVEKMPEYGAFASTESETVPQSYYIPAELTTIIDRLTSHGIKFERLAQEQSLELQEFGIDSTKTSRNAFQGHKERNVWGKYRSVTTKLPVGTVVVNMNQPLARLAFTLLEPRSDDGFLDWNFLDSTLDKSSKLYPIRRKM